MGKSNKKPVASPRKPAKPRKASTAPKAAKAPMDMETLIRQVGERVMRRLEDEVRQRQQQAGKRSSGKLK
jgi:hypothetical protein